MSQFIQDKERIALLGKLHSIMGAVGNIKKDKKNTFHNYEYASDDAVKGAFQKAFLDSKVFFTCNVTDTKTHSRKSPKGDDIFLTSITINYQFIDIETGYSIDGAFKGFGEDKGDKGLYKAITGATKYILRTNFLISTGDDPELDNRKPKQSYNQPAGRTQAPPQQNYSKSKPQYSNPNKPASQPQIKKIYAMHSIIKTSLGLSEDIKEYVQANLGKASMSEVTMQEAGKMIDHLQAQIDAINNKNKEKNEQSKTQGQSTQENQPQSSNV